jgi:hypothetical protein
MIAPSAKNVLVVVRRCVNVESRESAHGDFHRFSPLSGEVTHAAVIGKLMLIDG